MLEFYAMKEIKKDISKSFIKDIDKFVEKEYPKKLKGDMKQDTSNLTGETRVKIKGLLDIGITLEKLYAYNINNHTETSTLTLYLIVQYIELEDENKRLTLTKDQYDTWLKTDKQFINTNNFEIIYGLSPAQQKRQRNKINDPLPYIKLSDTSNVLYKRDEVDKWFENYKRK